MSDLWHQPLEGLTLESYLSLVQDLPLPTSEQRKNFVKHVARAHSWYKHLPPYSPGVPFYFFIDRFAGCDRVVRQDGSAKILKRRKRGFHYADLPTANYRACFGFLNYCCAEGVAVVRLEWGPVPVPRDKVAAVPGKDGKLYSLPGEVLEVARADLTAVIHPRSPAYDFWDSPGVENLPWIHWPAESGGRTTLQRIFKRAAEMRKPGEREKQWEAFRKSGATPKPLSFWEDDLYLAGLDPVLHQLMEPERQRQEKEMLKAIDRVCQLIADYRG